MLAFEETAGRTPRKMPHSNEGFDCAAQQHKEKFWLYVVENAGPPEQQIHRIQNPAELVQNYVYNHGWRNVAKGAFH